ncbi:helix-turn-helix domain-containing protein [Domibacillus sp. A3M-37]|uniref:helix-turn-helix domain-containing protein n=1 Tax=Domibacillus TaxID=1433999 RepID=UPI0020B72D7D|nr:helix-turn-helix transcriptional regulator [Domibacillus sp. A3M-37]MCP3761314.1 helix-turn-helix domain-containing protein [Domibacillus sp. A3M-37]
MIGVRIKERRVKQGLSLSQLAKKATISKSYLFTIETKPEVNPSLSILHRLAYALDMKTDDLIKEDEENSGMSANEFLHFRHYLQQRKAGRS